MVKVKFFARLREQLQCSELEVELAESTSIAQLKHKLVDGNPNWQQALASGDLLCALNQTLCSSDTVLSDNDEVAFFPPVTGG
ncbi:molybdopterin converting factor subunit 1 [Neptunicella marina]|uniref:Molybdopterin synthase sulfur carrier subunit n=1 Tax=Neptunicella marina TaxID=2125989 RepID=A0A8J6IU30_9ALTE|nr:molybdopterin converting factor subunit 1 [Neptunicella marina]MBC3767395.1 molybdopterin converting factor subunit 1 [Neptunicella marina]